MKPVVSIDIELDEKGKSILDIGAIRNDGAIFHKANLNEFEEFIRPSEFVVGHNIIEHDIPKLTHTGRFQILNEKKIIDTLPWSALLFPKKPYHSLVKDYKLVDNQADQINDPLLDSTIALRLLEDEIQAFHKLSPEHQSVFFTLLYNQPKFSGFFDLIGDCAQPANLSASIASLLHGKVCQSIDLKPIIASAPVELAFCISLIHCDDRESIFPAWVIHSYTRAQGLLKFLCNTPCETNCSFCAQRLDIHKALYRYFAYNEYRPFDGVNLQEQAVQAAVDGKSILAIFPTGGGKSLTFQVPALMSGENEKGLTVVISPLQSLMKDQVDNLEELNITQAATINGLLDPIERANAIERVENGSASILYISPESLRSKSIERMIQKRNVVRFVIDEAHCFSSWGHDFRVDYLYIGPFIKQFQENRRMKGNIPVSCFTATARRQVVFDIQAYFKEHLELELELFKAQASRTNLHYSIENCADDSHKYQRLRDLIEEKNCPTIVYVSRTKRAETLAKRLQKDGFTALEFHGKLEPKTKREHQNKYIKGEVNIMVATSAFGMGVDKKDVGLVVHYNISDSLENYVQEAGRAGRDPSLQADCYVLFEEADLDAHFMRLNESRLSKIEIQQIWKSIKFLRKNRPQIQQSTLEIARNAGWDDMNSDIETRVKTAIAALENAGLVERKHNVPQVFADSILAKTLDQAIQKMDESRLFLGENEKQDAIRILKSLIGKRSRKMKDEEVAESRVDYLADTLGLTERRVIDIIERLRESRILSNDLDLAASMAKTHKSSREHLKTVNQVEAFVLSQMKEGSNSVDLKELNETAQQTGIPKSNINLIYKILNFWAIKSWIQKSYQYNSKTTIEIKLEKPIQELKELIETKQQLSVFILDHLDKKILAHPEKDQAFFSLLDIKQSFEASTLDSFGKLVESERIKEALLFLSKLNILVIEGGFLVTYNRLTLAIGEDSRRIYTSDDYKQLKEHYEQKMQQIHIVGEYAKKLIDDPEAAEVFVSEYFQNDEKEFIKNYFKGERAKDLKLNLSPKKHQQLFGDLSDQQKAIIQDTSPFIVVAAGPGSGKTKVLVHKLASLLLLEEVRSEQLLMLTFSRAAATEFKMRLAELIGNLAHYVEIKTFHSYCFDLLGRHGNLEKSDAVHKEAIERIKNDEIDPSRLTKSVLVIDEAQDMDSWNYKLVQTLIEINPDMRLIAVGDDDQNIFAFRGSKSQYFTGLIQEFKASKHELTNNYRSKQNLVQFSNIVVSDIKDRLKLEPIVASSSETGRISITQHSSHELTPPLIEEILVAKPVNACVLTKTNQEALEVCGMLNNLGLKAQLIQSNSNFKLNNLHEFRYFHALLESCSGGNKISLEDWEKAKLNLKSAFIRSTNLESVMRMLHSFENAHSQHRYQSDLLQFVHESELEDFFAQDSQSIVVSTMHKSKGREFDSVYLMLNDEHVIKADMNRLIYVAITRAKSNLHIHTNTEYFKGKLTTNLKYSTDSTSYPSSKRLTLQLDHKGVNLGSFITRQDIVKEVQSGDNLIVTAQGCTTDQGNSVLLFSDTFKVQIAQLAQRNYKLISAKANHVIYWFNKNDEKEYLIVLPEVVFEKISSDLN